MKEIALTAEAIWEIAISKSDTYLGQVKIINKLFRQQDDSHLWPVNGSFSVIERAIGRVRKMNTDCPLSYALSIEKEESEIVNNENNW